MLLGQVLLNEGGVLSEKKMRTYCFLKTSALKEKIYMLFSGHCMNGDLIILGLVSK